MKSGKKTMYKQKSRNATEDFVAEVSVKTVQSASGTVANCIPCKHHNNINKTRENLLGFLR